MRDRARFRIGYVDQVVTERQHLTRGRISLRGRVVFLSLILATGQGNAGVRDACLSIEHRQAGVIPINVQPAMNAIDGEWAGDGVGGQHLPIGCRQGHDSLNAINRGGHVKTAGRAVHKHRGA